MKALHLSIIYVIIIIGSGWFLAPSATAHLVSEFSVKPDKNYTDPITQGLLTKDNHTSIIISQGSTFVLPMILKSEDNDSKMTSYSFHTTYGNNFGTEIMPPGIFIDIVPRHLILMDGNEQKINVTINVSKNAYSGIYSQNLVTQWQWNNNVTSSSDVTPIYFQVGKWNWNSPLNQFNAGAAANNVICANNLTLVIKTENSSPACVKPDTSKILIERGWAKTLQ